MASAGDERYEIHQEVFVCHPQESWVRGVVTDAHMGRTRSGSAEARYNVTIRLDPVTLPSITAADAQLRDVPAASLHQLVQQGRGGDGSALQPDADDDDWGADSGHGAAPSSSSDCDELHDLLHLSYLHDSTLLEQVRRRYFKSLIYTHIGPIILALNPYDFTLPNYVDANMPRYIAEGDAVLRSGSVNLPHSWSTAHLAYFNLLRNGANQSVIVSGESGAGKTETAKIVVKYLGFVSTDNANAEERDAASAVTRRVNLTSPILEAFGNAKTRFNDNSSRFGKFMKVHFSDAASGVMIGASMEVYLLEKSRIITHGPEERGYHCFYQLVASRTAASAAEAAAAEQKQALKEALRLTDADSYPSLGVGRATRIPGVDDARDFDEVCAAMDAVGLTGPEQQAVWRVAAGVLHALKITFTQNADDGCNVSESAQTAELPLVATLLGVDEARLAKELTTTTTTVRSDTFTKALRVPEATDYRDSICKALYEALFLWLVARVNDLIAPRGATAATSCRWIALLDIFGFENFSHGNRFEQLCINLANETLQNHYNSIIFTRDMEECRAENINTESVTFYDNQPCLDLICGFDFSQCSPTNPGKATARVSIMSLLDEESLLANGSDLSLCDKLGQSFGAGSGSSSPLARRGNVFDHDGHPNFLRPKTARNSFTIRHYAGDVTYTVDGFRARNLDSTKEELREVFRQSTDAFVAGLLGQRAQQQRGGRTTVAGFFKTQLVALMREINSTHPHWIRCIKPHSAKKPRMFCGLEVMTQLKSAGVLETVRIRQQSFAIRQPFADFAWEFSLLARRLPRRAAAATDAAGAAGGDAVTAAKDVCRVILQRSGLTSDELAQVGRSKVFLRTEAFYSLSSQRHQARVCCSDVLTAMARARASAWRTACLLRAARVRAIQAWLLFRPSHVELRRRELRAREAFLLVTFRELLLLQAREHTSRECDVEAPEETARGALLEAQSQSMSRLLAEWTEAKRRRDEAERRRLEAEECEARRALFCHAWLPSVARWRALHECVVSENEGRDTVSADEVREASQFENAHQQISSAIRALRLRQIADALADAEAAELRERRVILEPAASRAFRGIVYSDRIQRQQDGARGELVHVEVRAMETLLSAHAAAWETLVQRWWQEKQGRDARMRRSLRAEEKAARGAVAMAWLQELMVLLEGCEREREAAVDATARRMLAEANEAARLEAEAVARERQQQELDREQHRRHAQRLWRAAQAEEAQRRAALEERRRLLAADAHQRVSAVEHFRAMREHEARRRGRLSSTVSLPRSARHAEGTFSRPFAAAAAAAAATPRRSPSHSVATARTPRHAEVTADEAVAFAQPQAREPFAKRSLSPSRSGTDSLMRDLTSLTRDAADAVARAAFPVTVADAAAVARPSAPDRCNSHFSPSSVRRRSPSAGLSPTQGTEGVAVAIAAAAAGRSFGRWSRDPFDPAWRPPAAHLAFLPDGTVVPTLALESAVNDNRGDAATLL